jgi:hypothetical protein
VDLMIHKGAPENPRTTGASLHYRGIRASPENPCTTPWESVHPGVTCTIRAAPLGIRAMNSCTDTSPGRGASQIRIGAGREGGLGIGEVPMRG